MSRSRDVGSRFAREVAEYLAEMLGPGIERRVDGGTKDRGDLTGLDPDWVAEIKREKTLNIAGPHQGAVEARMRERGSRHLLRGALWGIRGVRRQVRLHASWVFRGCCRDASPRDAGRNERDWCHAYSHRQSQRYVTLTETYVREVPAGQRPEVCCGGRPPSWPVVLSDLVEWKGWECHWRRRRHQRWNESGDPATKWIGRCLDFQPEALLRRWHDSSPPAVITRDPIPDVHPPDHVPQ